jgi:hypothetical protein
MQSNPSSLFRGIHVVSSHTSLTFKQHVYREYHASLRFPPVSPGLTVQEQAENDKFVPEEVAAALTAMVTLSPEPLEIADIVREDLRCPLRR